MMPSKKRHQPMTLPKLWMNNKKIDSCYSNIAGLTLNLLSVLVTTSSIQAAEEKARRADDFVDSVGVNTHLQYNESVYYKRYNDLIKPKLLELGVRHIRDACTPNQNGFMERLKELRELGGIRTTMVCDPRDIKPQGTVSLIKELGTDVVETAQ